MPLAVAVHLHVADADWVMRPDPAIRHWDGETLEIAHGVTLLRLGGHFPGGTVLHWADGADGRGALLSGDIVQVAADLEPGLVSLELSEHDATRSRDGTPDRRHLGAVALRPDLRGLPRTAGDGRRRARCGTIGRALY